MYIFVRINQNVHLKQVHLIVCKLEIYKIDAIRNMSILLLIASQKSVLNISASVKNTKCFKNVNNEYKQSTKSSTTLSQQAC